jgi:lipopolysaccharide transport system permease protein
MFLSPIFLPAPSLPLRSWRFACWNPRTVSIKQIRNVPAYVKPSGWQRWGIHASVWCLIASPRFAWFEKMQKGLANVV